MFYNNNTNAGMFFELSGLKDSLPNRLIYFALALTLYTFTLFVNLTLILTVLMEKTLHEPLFILVCNLCFSGICGASTFYPRLLYDLLTNSGMISYEGCITQVWGIYFYIFCQYTTLTLMAYDRYLAICQPLRYHTVMTVNRVLQLIILTWISSFFEVLSGILLTARLPLCGYKLSKIFCTNWEVVKLSCTDTTLNNINGYVNMLYHFSQFILIVVSYIYLVQSSLKFQARRKKFVQTCVPHLVTLLVFTFSVFFDLLFTRYGQNSSGTIGRLLNALAAEFLVVPPIINPLIYGINLHQIRTKILNNLGRSLPWCSG